VPAALQSGGASLYSGRFGAEEPPIFELKE
jgi:hypothetical protein